MKQRTLRMKAKSPSRCWKAGENCAAGEGCKGLRPAAVLVRLQDQQACSLSVPSGEEVRDTVCQKTEDQSRCAIRQPSRPPMQVSLLGIEASQLRQEC